MILIMDTVGLLHYFFFQAEDGIRDVAVTGVQTCALPISVKEYLAVLETNHHTPYFLKLHHRDVAHTMVLGRTGAGKSFLLNFLVSNLQKYDPWTFIFDLGGSFEIGRAHV